MKYSTGCKLRDAENISDEAFYQRVEEATKRAITLAVSKALAIPLDSGLAILGAIPLEFGHRWAGRFSRRQRRLLEFYGDHASHLFGLAIRLFEYAKWERSGALKELITTSPSRDEIDPHTTLLSTPDGYAEIEGWAATFYDCVSDTEKPDELLVGSVFGEFPVNSDLLEAISIAWFFDASRLYTKNNPLFMDVLSEAAEAGADSHGAYMWDEGVKDGGDNPAAAMAKRRHAEHYALASDALKYWRENIDPTLSAERAADDLLKVVPLGHKKLAALVSAEKNKVSRLRKAESERKT